MRHDFSILLYDLEYPPSLTERQAGLCILLRARLKALARKRLRPFRANSRQPI